MKILVTGGVRSGKSAHAESLLAHEPAVTYVAPGPTVAEDTDPDWRDRVAAHQARRPASWSTLETRDLGHALEVDGPVLVDCLGTWLTAVVDEARAWEQTHDEVQVVVDAAIAGFLARLGEITGPVVVVTNEVGLGVVPEHRSGRLFRDLLGRVNQAVAAACDEVHLVVAGRVLVL
jgi:adenosylcobinamide kinase / adenosylcobinamide-phosphate guanylyltransferase